MRVGDPSALEPVALDDPAIDPSGMLATVEESPAQWDDALARARGPWVAATAPPTNVVVAGMGGSAMAGDVAAVLVAGQGSRPLAVWKGYGLPAWVGSDTLVAAVSYSGNTEETLEAVGAADRAGARIVAITSGGELAQLAASRGWPLLEVPGGRQPRASLGYLAVPLLVALVRCQVLPETLLEVLAGLPERLGPLVAAWGRAAAATSPAKATALALADRLPVLYGGRGVGALVAARGKAQINENAKRPAFAGELPELHHNEICGWTPASGHGVALLLVRDRHDHPQVRRRFDVTEELAPVEVLRSVELPGTHPLDRLASGFLFVDLLSVYLAVLVGVDPTPVATIEELKRRIARTPTDPETGPETGSAG